MSILLTIVFSFLSSFLYIFLYWKRLKEDYETPLIFSTALYGIGGVVAGGLFANFFLKKLLTGSTIINTEGLWFWGAVAGYLISLLLVTYKYKMHFFENLEPISPALTFWLSTLFLARFLITKKIMDLGGMFFLLFLFFLFFYLDNKYKKFSWYKSGKIGFSGLTTLGIFFLTRAGVAVFLPSMLSFTGRIEGVISAVFAFLIFFALYNLSEFG